jgi:hypothetical protein
MLASDLLARIGGLMMVGSSLWNGLMSFIWFFSLIWVCVGMLWLIPMVLAIVVFGMGVATMALGHQKWAVAGPVISLIVSICNFNIFCIMLDLVSLGLIAGSLFQRQQEEAQGLV